MEGSSRDGASDIIISMEKYRTSSWFVPKNLSGWKRAKGLEVQDRRFPSLLHYRRIRKRDNWRVEKSRRYRPIYIRGIDSINQLVNRASKRSARLSRERTFLSLTLTVSITVWKLMGEEWRAWKGRVKSFRLNQGILIRPSRESFFFFFLRGTPLKLGRVSGRRVSDTRDYKEAYLTEGWWIVLLTYRLPRAG